MSHGFYVTYPGAYPRVEELRRFWETTLAEAGLVDAEPWQRVDDAVEQVASAGDLDVELAVFFDADAPCEVSIEGHWTTLEAPPAYRSIVRSARTFADATHGTLEDFDAGADVEDFDTAPEAGKSTPGRTAADPASSRSTRPGSRR